MPYQRLAVVILAKWREDEREMSDLAISPEAMADLQAAADRLRDECQGYIQQAIKEHQPELPPFPQRHA